MNHNPKVNTPLRTTFLGIRVSVSISHMQSFSIPASLLVSPSYCRVPFNVALIPIAASTWQQWSCRRQDSSPLVHHSHRHPSNLAFTYHLTRTEPQTVNKPAKSFTSHVKLPLNCRSFPALLHLLSPNCLIGLIPKPNKATVSEMAGRFVYGLSSTHPRLPYTSAEAPDAVMTSC